MLLSTMFLENYLECYYMGPRYMDECIPLFHWFNSLLINYDASIYCAISVLNKNMWNCIILINYKLTGNPYMYVMFMFIFM